MYRTVNLLDRENDVESFAILAEGNSLSGEGEGGVVGGRHHGLWVGGIKYYEYDIIATFTSVFMYFKMKAYVFLSSL